MHGRHLQELLNRRLLPGCQGVMELHHVFQDGRLGEYLTDQRLDGLLYALELDHLRDQQVHHIALDPWAVLHGAGHIRRHNRRAGFPILITGSQKAKSRFATTRAAIYGFAGGNQHSGKSYFRI